MDTQQNSRALSRSLTPSGMSIVPSHELVQAVEEPIDSTPIAPPGRRRRLGMVVAVVVAAAVGVLLVAGGQKLTAHAKDSAQRVGATLEVLELALEPSILADLSEATTPPVNPPANPPVTNDSEPTPQSAPHENANANSSHVAIPAAPVSPAKASKPMAPSTPKKILAPAKQKPLRTTW